MCLRTYADREGPDQHLHSLASMQSDQGLHCLQTDSLDTIECFNGEQLPVGDFEHVQDDVNLYILCMLKGPFLLDMAQLI